MSTSWDAVPMLAKKYDPKKTKTKFPLLVQPKLDGVRVCWNGNRAYSRTGKPLNIGGQLLRNLETAARGIPLDGELYAHDATFEQISGGARRLVAKTHEVPLTFVVFDLPGTASCGDRLRHLKSLGFNPFDEIKDYNPGEILTLEHSWLFSVSEIESQLQTYISRGFEGMILRNPDAPYLGKRTPYLLKYKRFIEEEATVVGLIPGKGKHEGRLGALRVRGVSWVCNVGTGFSDEERERFWDSPECIMKKLITVSYQEKTANGTPRFPSFKGVRDYE